MVMKKEGKDGGGFYSICLCFVWCFGGMNEHTYKQTKRQYMDDLPQSRSIAPMKRRTNEWMGELEWMDPFDCWNQSVIWRSHGRKRRIPMTFFLFFFSRLPQDIYLPKQNLVVIFWDRAFLVVVRNEHQRKKSLGFRAFGDLSFFGWAAWWEAERATHILL